MTITAADTPAVAFSELCHFWPKQWEATEAADTHRYTLFGGARGPGKSYWLRWYAIRRLLKWAQQGFQRVRVMLACEDYPALYERHITKLQEFPVWLGSYRASRNEYVLAPQYGGGVIALRNLDDAAKYKSAEFAGILVDELTANPSSVFDMLRGSLRWPGLQDTFFAAASNPDGRYHKWVRKLWVQRDFPPELAGEAEQFVFVPAVPRDNPALSDEYWHMLDTLPRHLKEAWVDGNWFVALEGLVYGEFSSDNIEDYIPHPDLPVELAFDDGYVDPRAILFIQRTPMHIHVFDEIYESRRLEAHHMQAILDRMGTWFGWRQPGTPGEEDQVVYENPEGLLRPAVMPEIAIGSSEAAVLMRHFRMADIVARGGTHQVVEGLKVVRQLICDGQGYRALKVAPRCRNLIEEITSGYQYPPEGSRRDDEKPIDGNDHACDALRYWCWVRARR